MSESRYARVRRQIEVEAWAPFEEEAIAASVCSLLEGEPLQVLVRGRRRDLAYRIAWLIAVHAPRLDPSLTVILPLRLDLAMRGLAPLVDVINDVHAAELRVRGRVAVRDWSTRRADRLAIELDDALASRMADPGYLDRAIDALVSEPDDLEPRDSWTAEQVPTSHRRPLAKRATRRRRDPWVAFVDLPGVANEQHGGWPGTRGVSAWLLPWAWMGESAPSFAASASGRDASWLAFLRGLLRDSEPRTRRASIALAVQHRVVALLAPDLVERSASDPDDDVRGEAAAAVLTLRRTG